MKTIVAVLMASAVVATHGFAAEKSGHTSPGQFDLICTGTVTTVRSGATDFKLAPGYKIPGPEAYSVHLRVDLDRNLYCLDECRTPSSIDLVTPGDVTFADNPGDHFTVDRADGTFKRVWTVAGNRFAGIPLLLKTVQGTCKKGPFTSLPQGLF